MNPLVIYHKDCNDGFCAALVARRYFREQGAEAGTYVPAQYGDVPPDVKGKDVFILDFSYSRDLLLVLKDEANSIVVLDHHKTAQADLQGLDFCRFDLNKSGARLTAEYFAETTGEKLFDETSGGWLVDYTEDRDLWRWKLPDSKEVNAAIASYPRDFSVWWDWCFLDRPDRFVIEGTAILRYQNQIVDNLVKNAHEIEMDGYKVLSVNTGTLISEVAGKLAEGRPFGVCYFDLPDKRIYSLRSRDDGIDVSEIAGRRGGGGHRSASGFTEKL